MGANLFSYLLLAVAFRALHRKAARIKEIRRE